MNQQLKWSKKIVTDRGKFQTLKKEKEKNKGDVKETHKERRKEATAKEERKKNKDK
jgi:hypothetical protein